MKQKDIKKIIGGVLRNAVVQAESISDHFDEKAILLYKKELKIIRSFMSFVRAHKGEQGMRMPDKIKKLYNIAGAVSERLEEIDWENKGYRAGKDEDWDNMMLLAKAEWKKHYQKSYFQKFEKQLTDFDYGGIPPELINNFFNTQLKAGDSISVANFEND